jgi:hypothetical protein
MSLNKELSGSRATLESFEKVLNQKHSIEQEMLNRFLEMRHFLVSEVSKFYSIGFYVISLIIFYFTTTPVRTAEARFWIFILFGVNFVLERFTVSDVVSDHDNSFSALWMLTDDIDNRIWFCRKVTLSACFLILLYFAISYKDYAVLNNNLLLDIQKQNEELKRLHFLSLSRYNEKMEATDARQRSSQSSCDADFYSDDSGEESDTDSVLEISDSEVKSLTEDAQALPAEVTSTSSDEMTHEVVTPVIVSKTEASNDSTPRYNLRTRVTPTLKGSQSLFSKITRTRNPSSSSNFSTPSPAIKTPGLAVFSSDDE